MRRLKVLVALATLSFSSIASAQIAGITVYNRVPHSDYVYFVGNTHQIVLDGGGAVYDHGVVHLPAAISPFQFAMLLAMSTVAGFLGGLLARRGVRQ